MQREVVNAAARYLGIIFGALAGLCAYFLFGFHFWQSFAIAWFTGLLFSALSVIVLLLMKLAGPL